MTKNKNFWMVLGLCLFVFGFTAITLQMVGVQWAFLRFLEIPGRLFAFVFKIFMVIAGIVTIVLARTDWERERQESE